MTPDPTQDALARLAAAPRIVSVKGLPPGFPKVTERQLHVLRLISLKQAEKGRGGETLFLRQPPEVPNDHFLAAVRRKGEAAK